MNKYKLEEGLESLNRVKLLMSYKNDMTLTENEKKIGLLSEQNFANAVKTTLQACGSEIESKKTFTEEKINEISRNFFDAYEGAGTDWDLIKKALGELKTGTFADLCSVKSKFEERYGGGESFFEWIDSDIDDDTEWVEFSDTFINLKEKFNQNKTADIQSWPDCISGYETRKDSNGVEVKVSPEDETIFYYKNFTVFDTKNNKKGKYQC